MAYRTVYPYTNEVLQTYDPATDAELEQALAAGHALYKQWRDADPAPRARILHQIAARLRAKRTEYATIMTHDMGKLIVNRRTKLICVRRLPIIMQNTDQPFCNRNRCQRTKARRTTCGRRLGYW